MAEFWKVLTSFLFWWPGINFRMRANVFVIRYIVWLEFSGHWVSPNEKYWPLSVSCMKVCTSRPIFQQGLSCPVVVAWAYCESALANSCVCRFALYRIQPNGYLLFSPVVHGNLLSSFWSSRFTFCFVCYDHPSLPLYSWYLFALKSFCRFTHFLHLFHEYLVIKCGWMLMLGSNGVISCCMGTPCYDILGICTFAPMAYKVVHDVFR